MYVYLLYHTEILKNYYDYGGDNITHQLIGICSDKDEAINHAKSMIQACKDCCEEHMGVAYRITVFEYEVDNFSSNYTPEEIFDEYIGEDEEDP